MPELPDIQVFASNLKKIYVRNKIIKIKVVNGENLADTQSTLTKALMGKTLTDIFRSGKELRFKFSNDLILGVHLMLTGDLIPFENKNDRKSTIVELYFSNGKALALVDRFKKAYVRLNPVEKKGIDALDTKLNFKYLKVVCNRKAAIKNILLDQNVIRGIGNGYSDEILWRCKISPFSISKAIPDNKLKELASMIKKVLKTATDKIMKSHPGLVHGEIRDFLSIHSPHKTQSPTGAKIKVAKRGMLKTYYTNEQVLYK